MKQGKVKFIFSTLCLIAAVALAVFTVYAWFVTFTEVNTGRIDSVVTSGDITLFEISYYYTTSSDGKSFAIRKNADGDIQIQETNGRKLMPQYEPRLNDKDPTVTGVLVDMKIKFSKAGTYTLFANANADTPPYAMPPNQPNEDQVKEAFKKFTTANFLSNVVHLQRVRMENGWEPKEGATFNVSDGQYKFVTNNFNGEADELKKQSPINLLPNENYTVDENAIGNTEHHIYFLMDYMPEQISAIYSVMLKLYPNDARLDTQITFQQDVVFVIGKSDTQN